MIGGQASPDRFGLVVFPLVQILPLAFAVRALCEGIEGAVKRGLALLADEPSGEPVDENFIGHLNMQDSVEPLPQAAEHFIERLRLRQRPWKSVQDYPRDHVGGLEPFPQHVDRDRIGNQVSPVHELPGQHAEPSLPLHVMSKKVS